MTAHDHLTRWLAADGVQAPYLVSAARGEQLNAFVAALRRGGNLEVLTVPADESVIAIKHVRQIFTALTVTTLSERRLIIIPGAERLSLPAAAALLKHLEEPAPATRYLLTTIFPQRLLPTIISRCQRLRLADTTATETAGDDAQKMARAWEQRLREGGPTPALKLAFTRLRDYYHIVSLRGNEKLAKDVLIASAPPDEA